MYQWHLVTIDDIFKIIKLSSLCIVKLFDVKHVKGLIILLSQQIIKANG